MLMSYLVTFKVCISLLISESTVPRLELAAFNLRGQLAHALTRLLMYLPVTLCTDNVIILFQLQNSTTWLHEPA